MTLELFAPLRLLSPFLEVGKRPKTAVVLEPGPCRRAETESQAGPILYLGS